MENVHKTTRTNEQWKGIKIKSKESDLYRKMSFCIGNFHQKNEKQNMLISNTGGGKNTKI